MKKLDYFIFASGVGGKGFAIYCPIDNSVLFTEKLNIFGNSQLLYPSTRYIYKTYNADIHSIFSVPPQFTLFTKNSLFYKEKNNIIIYNNFYRNSNKINIKYFIKVEGKNNDKKWLITNNKNKEKIYTKNNIRILSNCEIDEGLIKVNGFFYKKSNVISYSKVFI